MARLFPMFVKLDNRLVLVVGAGVIGEQKIRGLLDTGARIWVVALQSTSAVREWAGVGQITLEERAFSPTDLDGMFLVVVATASRAVNEDVFREAQRRGVLCNVVDVPEQCDFFYPAVVRRGDLQIAVSTGGQSPSLAQKLRQQLERQFGPGYEEWVARLGATRREVLGSNLDPERKRWLLQSFASREAFDAELELAAKEKAS
ncbi:MAG TPA: bifunctional precorrin-2 dehydrogenase/sirohydrochlorin ferrochelatase [Terriglobales bacterium]|jgi:precorrin-2 dehydrogenase/sirohydrochlorin ferrochelatase|nr:bifunctional precorrin-2 dehydrogenase/sirohydrochlorin ferrochelatase [Terriglobales bacterium]